jgi:hypothetical protein
MALILVTAGLAACSQTEARDQPDTWGPETAAYDAASGGVETAAADGVTDRFTSTPSSSQASRFPEPFGNSYWSGDLDLRYASAEGFAGFGFEQAAIGQQSVSHNDHSIRAQGQPDAPQIDLALGLDDSMNRNGNGNIQEPLQLAAASTEGAGATKSAECAAFEQDIDADLGEILRAGCQPTLAQMSALMDNPLGNVAMLFTQFDLYRMENPTNGKTANKGNYMGIAQFPNDGRSDQAKAARFFRRRSGARRPSTSSTGVPPASATCTTWACSRPKRGLIWATASSSGALVSTWVFRRRPRISWAPASGPRARLHWAFIWGRSGRWVLW